MTRGFWDDAPVCCVAGVLKVTSADELTRGSVVPDGLMGGWMGGTDVPDVLIRVSVEGGLNVMLNVVFSFDRE